MPPAAFLTFFSIFKLLIWVQFFSSTALPGILHFHLHKFNIWYCTCNLQFAWCAARLLWNWRQQQLSVSGRVEEACHHPPTFQIFIFGGAAHMLLALVHQAPQKTRDRVSLRWSEMRSTLDHYKSSFSCIICRSFRRWNSRLKGESPGMLNCPFFPKNAVAVKQWPRATTKSSSSSSSWVRVDISSYYDLLLETRGDENRTMRHCKGNFNNASYDHGWLILNQRDPENEENVMLLLTAISAQLKHIVPNGSECTKVSYEPEFHQIVLEQFMSFEDFM